MRIQGGGGVHKSFQGSCNYQTDMGGFFHNDQFGHRNSNPSWGVRVVGLGAFLPTPLPPAKLPWEGLVESWFRY